MNRNYFTPFLALLTILVLQSCTGYNIVVNTVPKPNTTLTKIKTPLPGWEMLPIYYGDDRPEEPYDLFARITVTGNIEASIEELEHKLREEAACIGADAVLLVDERYVPRSTVNGVAIAVNVVSVITIFTGDVYVDPMEVGEDYEAYEMEAIAIRFKGNEE